MIAKWFRRGVITRPSHEAMNTRQKDLELLEEGRDLAIDREHRQALLDSIYEQAKDSYLEGMRRELTNWLKRGFAAVPEEGQHPTVFQKAEMAQAEYQVQEIEGAIKRYTATPEYQAKLAQAIAKSSKKEADLLMVKQRKGFL